MVLTMKKFSESTMREAVSISSSFSELVRNLGVKYRSGGAWKMVKNRVVELGIDHSHFRGSFHKRGLPGPKKPAAHYLTNDPNRLWRHESSRLRKSLLEIGRDLRCEGCGLTDSWNGQRLILDVDHKDGDWKNNSPENLRFLCPNCHSQQESSGRLKISKCSDCDNFTRKSKRCMKCAVTFASSKVLLRHTKGSWPDNLSELAETTPITRIAESVGVTEAAVRKKFKRLGITPKPQGYWSKRNYSSGMSTS